MANEQTRGTTDFATQNTDSERTVKGRARQAVDQAKERAGEKIESRIVDSKARAADTLSGVASTLLSSSQQLREQQHEGASRAIERAAEGVERFANYLQQTDVDEVVEQVQDFARRQPAAFIGGAFALGFIASRFIKATSPYGSRRLPVPTDGSSGFGSSFDSSRGYEGGFERGSLGRDGGYGNTGDISGSLGYGAGLSTTGGGATGGGYRTSGSTESTRSYESADTARNTDDLGDGSPGLGGSNAGSR